MGHRLQKYTTSMPNTPDYTVLNNQCMQTKRQKINMYTTHTVQLRYPFCMARNPSPSPTDDPGSCKRKVPMDANSTPISLPVKRTRAEIQQEKESKEKT